MISSCLQGQWGREGRADKQLKVGGEEANKHFFAVTLFNFQTFNLHCLTHKDVQALSDICYLTYLICFTRYEFNSYNLEVDVMAALVIQMTENLFTLAKYV